MPFFGPVSKNQPRYQDQGQSESDRVSQFQALVEIIRTEIRVGVDPLRGDIQTLKSAVEDVRQAQRQVYTREVMDLKLRERDDVLRDMKEDIAGLRASHEEIRKTMGAFWMTSLTRVGAVMGVLATALALWQLLNR